MPTSIHGHDLSDKACSILAPLLPGQQGNWGGIAKDNRLFIKEIQETILGRGCAWYADPNRYHRRFPY